MLLAESSCVCITSFRPVASIFFLVKVPFLALFSNAERDVALLRCWKCFPGDTNSKYLLY